MKHIYYLLIILFLHSALVNGQNTGLGLVDGTTNPNTAPPDGSHSLGQTYNNTACGLSFTSASQKLGQRFHNATASSCVPFDGVIQPATFNITGIPTCSVIDKAYIWCSTSGNGIPITVTLQNPLGVTGNFPMTLIGTDVDKGWGATGSYTYRADVTSAIAGNGNYLISGLPTFPNTPVTGNDVDGATLFIIYRDLNATYSGTLVINDGCMVDAGGETISNTVSGFSTCANSQNGLAFLIVSDMQDVACDNQLDNQITIEGTTYVAAQEDWWNELGVNETITPGQTTMDFSINPSPFAFLYGIDFYDFLVAGVYFQTTTCTVCTPAAILIDTSSTAASCLNNDGTATATPSGGSGSYTYSWNTLPVQTTQTATGLGAGSYTVTVTDTNGCMGSASVTVAGAAKPAISVNPSAPVICNGLSVSLTATGGVTYTWSPTTGLSAGSGTTVSANPTTTTTFTVTGTNGSGCSNTSTVTVTVNAKPAININPSAPVLCNGQSQLLTASGANSYIWSPTTGLSAGSGTTVTANPTTTSTYTVTGTNGNGCTNTASVTVTINLKPTITVTPPSAILCNGQSQSLTAGGGSTYVWSPTTGLSSGTGTIVSANPATTTTYTVTGTDANGCTNTSSITVTVNPKPTITVNPLAPVLCNGQFVSLTGGGGNTYTWSPTTGLSSGSGTTVSANPSSTTTYTVTGTDGNGCTNTASVTVTVNALPVITANPISTVLCSGQSVSLTGGGGTTYIWSPSTGLSSGSGTTVTANPATTTTYTVTGTDGNGCTNTATATVNINQKPTISVNPSSPTLCSGQSTSLTASGANTYVWSPGTGLSSGSGTIVSANPTSTTTYTVTGTDGNGCTNTTTVTVTVNSSLTVTINPVSPVICLNQFVSLTAGGAITYSWSPTTGLSSGSGTTVSANPAATITYTVTGTAGTGCSNTASVTVTVNQLPVITASPVTTVLCNGQSVSLTGGGGTSYIWSPATGLSSGSGTTVSANPSSSATYTVTGTDANGCTNTASATVTVNPLPDVTVNPIAPAICNGQSVSLTGGGANMYIWSPGTGLSAGTGTVVSADPSSSITYTVTGTDGNNCTNTASVTVTVNPLPVVNAGPDANICPNDSAQLNVTGPPAGSTYSWTPFANLSCSSCANTFAFPQGTTTYSVLVTTLAGCSALDSVSVLVTPLAPVAGPDTAVCYGDAFQLYASGGTTYQWMPSTGINNPDSANTFATPLINTTYTVTVSSGSCTSSATVTVVVHPVVPTPTIVQSEDTLYCSFNAVYSSYQWYYQDTIIPNATNSFYVASQSGNYNVAVSDQFGCQISVGINIVLNVGLTAIAEPSGFSIYPNPAGNELIIKSSELRIKEIDIYDVLGKLVYIEQPETQNRKAETVLDVSNLSSGIYFIRIQQSQGNWVSRFVKE